MFRRNYFLFLAFAACSLSTVLAQPVGNWKTDQAGLPYYSLAANAPEGINANKKKSTAVYSDPYFILGNYQLHLCVHASGQYQLFSGERVWSRLNQAKAKNEGESGAGIIINGTDAPVLLTGKGSLAETSKAVSRLFGVGFVQFAYPINNQIACTRTLSAKPSAQPNEGTSAFTITVKLKNVSDKPIAFTYFEHVTSNYTLLSNSMLSHKVDYESVVSQDKNLHILKADVKATPLEAMLWTDKESAALYEGFPPSLFIKTVTESEKNAEVTLESVKDAEMKDRLMASFAVALKPKQEKEFKLVVGYAFDNSFAQIESLCQTMGIDKSKNENIGSAYQNEWKNRLPLFANETDSVLRHQLIWHAYNLQTQATSSVYFGETAIVPLSVVEQNTSTANQLNAIMPLCYIDKDLAKSALKYVMHKMDARGIIPAYELGYGKLIDAANQLDNSFYFLSALSEYIRTSGDVNFLQEKTAYYPRNNNYQTTVLQHVEQVFLLLRDGTALSTHGLMLRQQQESLASTGLVVKSLGEIVTALMPLLTNSQFSAEREHLQTLLTSMRAYRYTMLQALVKEMGATPSEKIDAATQAVLLQITDLPEANKALVWNEIKNKEKGNILDANLLIGLASMDRDKALSYVSMLKQPTPAPDAINSAKILYIYLKLKGL